MKAKEAGEKVIGTGVFMEGICQNPLYYDLALNMPLYQSERKLLEWNYEYAAGRYGYTSDYTESLISLLIKTAYKRGTDGNRSSRH